MVETYYFLILLGGLFLLSMVVNHISDLLNIPRVTLLILSGIAIGPWGLNLVNGLEQTWFPTISSITLLVIGYLLGTKLTKSYFLKYGVSVSITALIMTLVTFTAVLVGLSFIGLPFELAVILAAIAVATDPTATIDVIEQNKQKNNIEFKNLIRGVVALDDILGLLLFSIVLALLSSFKQTDNGFLTGLTHFSTETIGSLLIGASLGIALTALLNHKRHNRPMLVESFGLILLCGGLASYFELSYLIAAMVMGTIVINFAHKSRPHLHDIELIEQPFLILFFVLAGASLEITAISEISGILIGYCLLRLFGRFISGFCIPQKYTAAIAPTKLGLAFTSQAGVAMGMALVAANQFPQYRNEILTISISATVIFEILGPILTNVSLSYPKEKTR